MKKLALILVSIIISTVSILFFIHYSNDHVECETIVNKVKNTDGEIVTKVSHICKEKYSF